VCFIRDRKRYAQSIQQEGREVWRNARACTNSCGQGPSNALVWPIMSLAEVIANCAYSRKVVAGKSVSGLGSLGQRRQSWRVAAFGNPRSPFVVQCSLSFPSLSYSLRASYLAPTGLTTTSFHLLCAPLLPIDSSLRAPRLIPKTLIPTDHSIVA
jgi:hypothetical protein